MNVLIWGGPVSRNDLKVDLPPDTRVVTLNHGANGGIGSSAFQQLAQWHRGEDGHILPHFLASVGIDMTEVERVVLAGFSAFHGFANEVLKSDAEMVSGLISLDACFSSKDHLAKAGYVALSRRAIRGESLVVFTSSLGGGVTFSTGSECVWATVDQALAEEGTSASEYDPEGLPTPALAMRSGELFVLDYQGIYSHQQHVWELATPVLQKYLGLALEGNFGRDDTSQEGVSSHYGAKLMVLLGVVLVVATLSSSDEESREKE